MQNISNYTSQHGEDKLIDSYNIINKNSIILDIGANDGITYSNSRYFIQKYNCNALLVEPTLSCMNKLNLLYGSNSRVTLSDKGLWHQTGEVTINIGNFSDVEGSINQVSTIFDDEKKYWEGRGVNYQQETIQTISYLEFANKLKDTYLPNHPNCSLDLVSIDIEGNDLLVLQSILPFYPKFIIFEHNTKPDVVEHALSFTKENYDTIFANPVNFIFKHKSI